MAGRLQQLNAASGGINRLRTKGGASKETLYDLVNGWVDASGAMVSRPGTAEDFILPAGTKGLCSVNGALVVFSHTITAGMPVGVTCEVLTHPVDAAQPIKEIHFAAPFLGGSDGAYLYVVAEFADGAVYHYWLQRADAWTADTNYTLGAMVQPTVPNGFFYRARRIGATPIPWAPNVKRAVGAVVVPTTENGWDYTCIDTIGSDPKSGATEPTWPTEDGATVFEDTGVAAPPPPSYGGNNPPPLPDDVGDRYSGPPWRDPTGVTTRAL